MSKNGRIKARGADKKTFGEKTKDLLLMFVVFFKIGLFSFGGGYAMLTLIEHEVVEKRKWLTRNELMDIFAVAESTPGAIAINIATFIGTKREGIFGGVFSTLGVVLPSFIIIIALSYVIAAVENNKWVGYLFKGIRIGVLVLIAKAVLTFFKDIKKNWFSLLMVAAAFLIAFLTKVSVIYIILGSIILSALAVAFINWRNKHKYFMNGTAPYYNEFAGKTYQIDEYRRETDLISTNLDDKPYESAISINSDGFSEYMKNTETDEEDAE